MKFSRIGIVYRKELVDLLRDRRTVIATVVIPVVLYPLLILFSVQSVSIQTEKVAGEQITIGFSNENDVPVVGLREGAWLRIDGGQTLLGGKNGARVFRRGREPEEWPSGASLAGLSPK